MNVENHINQLPFKDLIAAPFHAVMESQASLAISTHEFIELIGFDKDGELKTIDFNVPIADTLENGAVSYKNEKVKAPVLSMIPIPSLMIDKVSVNFQVEIKASVENFDKYQGMEEESDKQFKLFSLAKTEMLGKITEAKENTRKTSQGAKYNFHVEAKMQDKPEGLQKVLDLIIARMTP